MNYQCSQCGREYDNLYNLCRICDTDTIWWSLAMIGSEVRHFGVSFGKVNRKEWENGLNKNLLKQRNKELSDACKIFNLWNL